MLICLSEESENDDHIHEIIGDHIPVIMVDKIVDSESIGSVSIDDVETASKAKRAPYSRMLLFEGPYVALNRFLKGPV